MVSEHCDLGAVKAFFQSAKAVTDVTPDRVTTDGHDTYPRAIRTELGKHVRPGPISMSDRWGRSGKDLIMREVVGADTRRVTAAT
jgi:hypothetical protein